MPFLKDTFAPKNYQNLISFKDRKPKIANFPKTIKSKEEIKQALEIEILPLLEKWNNYKSSPDYQEQIILSGLFLILNFCVSFFYLMMVFTSIYLVWFIFTDDYSVKIDKPPIVYYFITFILILILLFPKIPSNRTIWRYFRVNKNLFFYNFCDDFKAEIINLCLFDYPNLAFFPNGNFIDKGKVKESGLFGRFKHFQAEDQISEIREARMNFKMAEIDLELQSGKTFSGLFFMVNFPTQNLVAKEIVENQTYILPKNYKPISCQKLEKVYLESPVFERNFEVYSDSQLISRLILQTDIMDRLNNFTANFAQKIYLSFTKNQLFAAVEFPKNLFEPTTFGKEKISNLTDFVNVLETINNLVETLKLEK